MRTFIALCMFAAVLFVVWVVARMSSMQRFVLFLMVIGGLAIIIFIYWYKMFTEND